MTTAPNGMSLFADRARTRFSFWGFLCATMVWQLRYPPSPDLWEIDCIGGELKLVGDFNFNAM